MKSQVGLERLYPDGRLDQALDTPPAEQPGDVPHEVTPAPAELVSVVVHVEKGALDQLLQRSTQS